MQIKDCTRATRKLRVTTGICNCECEMHCLVACRMLESNTTGWSFCKNPLPTLTLNTSTWSIKANWGLKKHETGPWAMSFLDSTNALPCQHDQQCSEIFHSCQGFLLSLWYSSFRWRLARAEVTTSTCQKECERLWLSFISDLKYVGETRYRISYHKIICTIQLWQNVLKTGNLPF